MLTQDQLNATYREVLGRDAPTSDLAAWNNVGGSINDYRNALIATPEFSDRYGEARRSMSPDDPRLNPAGFDPIAARQGPAFTQTVTGQPLPSAQPPAMQPPAFQTPRQQIPTQMPNTGGQPDWLGGILGQLFGGGMGSPNMLGRPAAGGGMARLGDLFGASPGQFGSGATGAQQTNAMSNPLSASPFGRNFSTRQMGIPARTMI
jgi:hypothetical protein